MAKRKTDLGGKKGEGSKKGGPKQLRVFDPDFEKRLAASQKPLVEGRETFGSGVSAPTKKRGPKLSAADYQPKAKNRPTQVPAVSASVAAEVAVSVPRLTIHDLWDGRLGEYGFDDETEFVVKERELQGGVSVVIIDLLSAGSPSPLADLDRYAMDWALPYITIGQLRSPEFRSKLSKEEQKIQSRIRDYLRGKKEEADKAKSSAKSADVSPRRPKRLPPQFGGKLFRNKSQGLSPREQAIRDGIIVPPKDAAERYQRLHGPVPFKLVASA